MVESHHAYLKYLKKKYKALYPMLFLVMIVKCNSMAWRMNSIVTELQSVQTFTNFKSSDLCHCIHSKFLLYEDTSFLCIVHFQLPALVFLSTHPNWTTKVTWRNYIHVYTSDIPDTNNNSSHFFSVYHINDTINITYSWTLVFFYEKALLV